MEEMVIPLFCKKKNGSEVEDMTEKLNSKKENMDKAIANKVLSVLTNSKFTQSAKIVIEAEVGSAPLIEYHLTEIIDVEDSGVTE